MEIDTKIVGTSLKEHSYNIEWRNTMNFAAAIDDNNPVYFDDEREEGIFAHPMFPVTTTWPIFSNLPDFVIGGNFPFELMMTVVHYSEYLILHRLLKPEEKIKLKGKIAAIIPHRAGTHIIACVKATDKQNDLIFTEYIGGMLRGVESIGSGKGYDQIPTIPQYQGDNIQKWRETISIDPLRPFIYDGCTNISFPIHTSKQFAHLVGLPDIILHGTATLSYAVKTLINREVGGNPQKVKEIACKFTGIVLPGTNIEIVLQEKLAGKNGIELFFDVYNENNKRAIRNGYIKINE